MQRNPLFVTAAADSLANNSVNGNLAITWDDWTEVKQRKEKKRKEEKGRKKKRKEKEEKELGRVLVESDATKPTSSPPLLISSRITV